MEQQRITPLLREKFPSTWRLLTWKVYGVFFSRKVKENMLESMLEIAYSHGREQGLRDSLEIFSRSIQDRPLWSQDNPSHN